MSSSDTSSSPMEVEHKRANTKNLVSPHPESTPSKYTSDRVQQGLTWAQQWLRDTTRKPSPFTEKALTIYAFTCKQFLDRDAEGTLTGPQRITLQNTLHKFDRDINSCYWFNCPDVKEQNLQDEYLQLRRYQLFIRYGDYVARIANNIRESAKTLKITKSRIFTESNYWTNIAKKLREEEQHWHDFGSRYPEKVPTTLAVYDLAHRTGDMYQTVEEAIYNEDAEVNGTKLRTALGSIEAYGTRNEYAHLGLHELIKEAEFHRVAKIIHGDLHGLPAYIGAGSARELDVFTAVLQSLRDEWFDASYHPNKPGAWVPTGIRDLYRRSMRKEIDKVDY